MNTFKRNSRTMVLVLGGSGRRSGLERATVAGRGLVSGCREPTSELGQEYASEPGSSTQASEWVRDWMEREARKSPAPTLLQTPKSRASTKSSAYATHRLEAAAAQKPTPRSRRPEAATSTTSSAYASSTALSRRQEAAPAPRLPRHESSANSTRSRRCTAAAREL